MRTTAALLFLLFALPLFADDPNVRNGHVTRVRASGDLLSQVTAARGWVGYELPLFEPRQIQCNGDSSWWDEGAKTDVLAMLYRVKDGAIDSIRVAGPDCSFNAHDEPVTWIENVGGREATDVLISVAKHNKSSRIRGQALFWLGMQAGAKAAQALKNAVDDDPESDVKARAVFGISQLPGDQSIPLLIDLMKTHRLKEVRRKAAFWLSQKNDPRAVAAIEEILLR
ncbi:MAG TPA: HEAT repeat domain-containing protein [Thermoanaerobaculia bacterium]|nr:HEAT repeat domain-containing protein [Thermoanaerobaculia bacterium]